MSRIVVFDGKKKIIYLPKGRNFYLMMHSTHFIYGVGHIVKDHLDKEETCCCHYMSYSFRLTTRVLLYEPFHKQYSTYWSTHTPLLHQSMGPP